jgi:hypothetical protein
MYELFKNRDGSVCENAVRLTGTNTFIPFDPANVDFQNFKKEVLAGAELQDDTGNVMTQAKADAFIATLP